MKPRMPTVKNGGLYADHDMSCAVHGCSNHAVLDLSEGIFQPCWDHQGQGYQVVRLGRAVSWIVGWFSG
jgi:hypothetical protein